MLTLKTRTCRIGSNLNVREEFVGDDSQTAVDIPLSEFHLDPDEYNALLQEPRAFDLHYVTKAGAPAEPVMKTLKAFRLAEKIEGATVELDLSGQTTLKIVKCKIARIEVTLAIGKPVMSCQIQCAPKLDSTMARLMEKLGAEITASISAEGYGEQQKLPLEAKSEKTASVARGKAQDERIRAATAAKAKRSAAKNGHATAR